MKIKPAMGALNTAARPAPPPADTSTFVNDLGADSLDTVELIMEFEKEFDIQIPDDQAEAIATVGDAISFIEKA